MIQSRRHEPLALILICLVAYASQQPLYESKSSVEYLTTPEDIHNVLSNIIKPGETVALLSDFDGTLAEIDPNPALSTIDPNSKYALEQLVVRPNLFVGFISGRPMYNLRSKVGLDNATYSGKHGMEILFSNQTEYHYPIEPEMYENCTKLKTLLLEQYCVNGAFLEDKNISLTWHYRNMPTELHEQFINRLVKVVSDFGYVPIQAHYAIEIKPPVDWTKGNAALLILQEAFGSDWHLKNVRAIFMGDDNSDEDAMRLLKGKGTTFRVTANPNLHTNADYMLQSVHTVTMLLEWLVAHATN